MGEFAGFRNFDGYSGIAPAERAAKRGVSATEGLE
jgi:hypothetical protein